ncbi:MAG TPA: DUF4184 family protein [Ohtaekwangia sp.]|nr:DUF4184 family protein [Ohtaekwangia sp.]
MHLKLAAYSLQLFEIIIIGKFKIMPFTPAHTALVLPFIRKRYLSATGLVAGSVAPDFEYFFKMSTNGVHGHTILGLFYFDVPVVILLAVTFHLVVKQNFIHHLPSFFQVRFQDTLQLDFMQYLRQNPWVFIFSALAGSASHLFWDSFTHGDGYFASTLWFYQGAIIPFNGARYPLFYFLQHLSTVIGLFILFVYIIRIKPVVVEKANGAFLLYWFTFVIISVAVVAIRFTWHPADMKIGNFVVSVISAICLALIICGLLPFRSGFSKAK